MRDKSFLFKFEEIATLYQYLYLEESHSIEITNILGVILLFVRIPTFQTCRKAIGRKP